MRPSKGIVRNIVVAAWAVFFGWLWLSEELSRYLGPRTYWVAPFGTIALGVAALAGFVTKNEDRGGATGRDLAGAALVVLPIAAVLAFPSPQLGAQAASRKAASGGVLSVGTIIAPPYSSDRVAFAEIDYAGRSSDYATSIGVGEGTEVTLEGFVAQRADAGDFELARFYVSCCAADAIAYSVSIDWDEPAPPVDAWLRVTGVLERTDEGFVVDADSVATIPPPDDPYLY